MGLETDQHLFCPPKYQGSDKNWRSDFLEVVSHENKTITWDLSAILSMISFGYACGDRTLITEVRRQPWLSSINEDGAVSLEPIPPHDFYWESPKNIAITLRNLLETEALSVCKDRSEIYILLSGGLDSRIVAGILTDLHNNGEISVKPIALTWGLENSRDVTYAKLVAKTLGIEIIPINLGLENIFENIIASADLMGNLVSPFHLHRMLWCKNLGKDALVLNGSYGDSVGRGEFSKKHILELDYLSPKDQYHLLSPSIYVQAFSSLNADLELIKARSSTGLKYVVCEHMMQSQYMRGLIGHAMTIINNFASIYHMFTAPEVYSYMWRLHPAARNNKVYAYLLDIINPDLSEIPWARTNKSVQRKTSGAETNLLTKFHQYDAWIAELYENNIFDILDPHWFKDTAIFNPVSIEKLRSEATKKPIGFRYDIPLWLCSFRILAEKLQEKQKELNLPSNSVSIQTAYPTNFSHNQLIKIRLFLRRSKFLSTIVPSISKLITKAKSLIIYPRKKKQ